MPFNNRAGNHGGFANPSGGGLGSSVAASQPPSISPKIVTTASYEMTGGDLEGISNVALSSLLSALATASLGIYVPFVLPNALAVNHLFWANGGAVAGNTDVGIYSADGTSKLVSTGSVVNAGVSAAQVVDVAGPTLQPGTLYWLAIVTDNAAHRYLILQTTGYTSMLDIIGVKTQAAVAVPLPASITLASVPTANYLPMAGFAEAAL